MSKEFNKRSKYGFLYGNAWSVLHHYWKGRDSDLTNIEMELVFEALCGRSPIDISLRMAEYLESEYEQVIGGSTDLPTEVCVAAFGVRPIDGVMESDF